MLGGILKKLMGDKSVKDRKDYQPIIDKSNEIFVTLSSISDDELRARTFSFQEQIAKATESLEKEVADLDKKANDPATSVVDKENIFDRIDTISSEIDEKIEEVLKDILPDAFATN